MSIKRRSGRDLNDHVEVEIRGHPHGQQVLAAVVKILQWIEEDRSEGSV